MSYRSLAPSGQQRGTRGRANTQTDSSSSRHLRQVSALSSAGPGDIDFGAFVGDLYTKIRADAWVRSMVIFCHETSQPVEWSPEQIHLLNQLATALCNGAMIIT